MDKKTIENLIVTEEQRQFLEENNLVNEIKNAIESNGLVNVDVDDFNIIMKDREIIGFVNHEGDNDFEIHKLKDLVKVYAVVYVESLKTLFETNLIINKIKNSFASDMQIIYGCGSGKKNKIFALITGEY